MDLIEVRPLIRTELTVNSLSGGQRIFRLVDCVATLDIVSEDFTQCFWLPTRKSKVRTPVRFANEQRVTSSTVFDISFERARHEFQRNFYVFRGARRRRNGGGPGGGALACPAVSPHLPVVGAGNPVVVLRLAR
jgi:hypothetical protein